MKLPLQVQHQWICDADGRDMLLMDTCSGEDMREIVRRCNAYDAMREALQDLLSWANIESSANPQTQALYAKCKSALKLTESP